MSSTQSAIAAEKVLWARSSQTAKQWKKARGKAAANEVATTAKP